MSELPSIPSTFVSSKSGGPRPVPLALQEGLDADAASAFVSAVTRIPWGDFWHAYGPANDVGTQLIAAALGDEQTRKAAWWELFGNIHHQGTVYEATVPAVPIIAQLALWRDYPDRIEAVAFLAAVADADGVVVWRYDHNNRLVYDEDRQAVLGTELKTEMREVSASLLSSWRHEPDEVKRALLLLLAHTHRRCRRSTAG
jgi:hypothetical protein